jgi:hypothetical protein
MVVPNIRCPDRDDMHTRTWEENDDSPWLANGVTTFSTCSVGAEANALDCASRI